MALFPRMFQRHASLRQPALLSLVLLASFLLFGTATAQTTRVRLLAGNITSGNNQSYDPGHGTRIFQGLKPDVAMIQEFNYGNNSASELQAWVTTAFGAGATYVRGPSAQIPNGIVSKYPIKSSGSWTDSSVSNRTHVWARIDIPGDKDLWCVSVHLLTSNSSDRNTEARQLRDYINAAGIPAGDFICIGGDFNTDSMSESCFSTLSGIVVTSSPYPADQNGKTGTNAGRDKPYDHVLVNTAMNAYQTPVVIGSNSHANGLVFDSRVYTPLSAVSPVLSSDSGASNMQHMAIVKDFLIPNGSTPTPSPSPSISPTPSVSPTASLVPTQSPILTSTPSPTPSPVATGAPINLSGYTVRQYNSSQSYVIPDGVTLQPGGILIITRNSAQAAFEVAWGATVPGGVTFINSGGSIPQINGLEAFDIINTSNVVVSAQTNTASMTISRAVALRDALNLNTWQTKTPAEAPPGVSTFPSVGAGLVITQFGDANDFNAEYLQIQWDPVVPTASPSLTPTPSRTPTPTASLTPTPSISLTPTPTASLTPSPSISLTPTPTPSLTPTPTASLTPSPTESLTPSPTESVTPTPTDSLTPTPTASLTPSPTESLTPSPTESLTPSPTVPPTATPTAEPTSPPTATPPPPTPTSSPNPDADLWLVQ